MSEARHSLGGIQKLIRELREVTLEIVVMKSGLSIMGGLSAVSMRHRRHEIRLDENGLAVMGIIIDGERIHRHTPKACSIRPGKWPNVQHPPQGSASPPSPSAPTPRGVFPGGEKGVTTDCGNDDDHSMLKESWL
jgi:hypothetical protein